MNVSNGRRDASRSRTRRAFGRWPTVALVTVLLINARALYEDAVRLPVVDPPPPPRAPLVRDARGRSRNSFVRGNDDHDGERGPVVWIGDRWTTTPSAHRSRDSTAREIRSLFLGTDDDDDEDEALSALFFGDDETRRTYATLRNLLASDEDDVSVRDLNRDLDVEEDPSALCDDRLANATYSPPLARRGLCRRRRVRGRASLDYVPAHCWKHARAFFRGDAEHGANATRRYSVVVVGIEAAHRRRSRLCTHDDNDDEHRATTEKADDGNFSYDVADEIANVVDALVDVRAAASTSKTDPPPVFVLRVDDDDDGTTRRVSRARNATDHVRALDWGAVARQRPSLGLEERLLFVQMLVRELRDAGVRRDARVDEEITTTTNVSLPSPV